MEPITQNNGNERELHVIFGAGPVGLTLADELLARGRRVRLVNRSGKAPVPAGVELVAADATNADAAVDLCRGAAVVYHCANVPYAQQYEVMPRLQESLMAGAAAAGARLVVTDTLYVYGETRGQVMTEETPFAATARKGRLRAQLAETYLRADREGRLRVALGRAADFFGPRVFNSALGANVFPAAIAGQPVMVLGDIDLPHSFSFILDVARGLATLGEREEALGRAWLLPVAPARTTREVCRLIEEALGRPVEIRTVARLEDGAAFGFFDEEFMREFGEMFYQYTEPQIVDSHRFEERFGWGATPLPEAIRATGAWFQAQATAH